MDDFVVTKNIGLQSWIVGISKTKIKTSMYGYHEGSLKGFKYFAIISIDKKTQKEKELAFLLIGDKSHDDVSIISKSYKDDVDNYDYVVEYHTKLSDYRYKEV